MKVFCQNEADTFALGMRLGERLGAEDSVLLYGEMGMGKSVLTRGIARGMGIMEPIPSPTFTILNIHEGPALRLYHFDFYRLSCAEEFYEAGLDEWIPAEDGVCVIEWPGIIPEVLPADALIIRLAELSGGREITLEENGRFSTEWLSAVAGKGKEL